MAYRFTNTDKWSDAWFSNLKPSEKLLFMYLCDTSDIAGFVELNLKKFSFDTGITENSIEGALKGLERGLTISKTGDCIYINNFLKHQKNIPLNVNNKAHLGILKRFELYQHKFNIENVYEFIEGASRGLSSPIGIGNGIGNGIGKKAGPKEEIKIPSEDEFVAYALENDKTVLKDKVVLKYKSWKENNWKDGNGKKISNWKSKILNTLPYIEHSKNNDQNNKSINSIWDQKQLNRQ